MKTLKYYLSPILKMALSGVILILVLEFMRIAMN